MTNKRADVLLNTMMVIEQYSLKRALTDLSQDEFDWEPHPGAWGVRRRSVCTTSNPLGAADGDWVVDNDWTIVEAAYQDWLAEKPVHDRTIEPMPTIGWLLNHFGAAPGVMAESEIVGGRRRRCEAHPGRMGCARRRAQAHTRRGTRARLRRPSLAARRPRHHSHAQRGEPPRDAGLHAARPVPPRRTLRPQSQVASLYRPVLPSSSSRRMSR